MIKLGKEADADHGREATGLSPQLRITLCGTELENVLVPHSYDENYQILDMNRKMRQ